MQDFPVGQEHEDPQKDRVARQVDIGLQLAVDRPAQDRLRDQEKQAAAVQARDGQQVHQPQVNGNHNQQAAF